MRTLLAGIAQFYPPLPAGRAETVDARMVALLRSLLALTALLIIYVDPLEPSRLIGVTYAALSAYWLYSIALCAAIVAGTPFVPARAQHWVDVAFYVFLVALTQGTSSIFFHFFFFAVLVASFSRGFGEGFAVTLASTVLFVVVGLAAAPTGPNFELDRALIRPVYLFLLGYMIAYWGGHEIALRRRLGLLQEVSTIVNPRLGADHALTRNLAQLLQFFGADECLLVCSHPGTKQYVMYRVDAARRQHGPSPIPEASADALLDLPGSMTLCWPSSRARADRAVEKGGRRLANLLEASSVISVPFAPQGGVSGRLYLASRRRRFREPDSEFLAQVASQIAIAVSNLQLIDELMAGAAHLERARISRDIHDVMIQPYIGLKLAVEALHRNVDPASPLAPRLKELLEMSASTVDDLRGYAVRLRSSEGIPAERLLASLREQVGRYRRFYGLEVELHGDPALQLSDRVAGEAYQMICEALSNVYRHSSASRACVELRRADNRLVIDVSNERNAASPTQRFLPRSIAERATALGGRVEVTLDHDGVDIVRVAIPL